ncbi:transposase family protein [Neobacillus ginsengisoli]|uniref:transposase family protein n=1 Tax=Neobacillus ginsengisoli TaxID=904295 RepID=UPI0027D7D050|nr:transposase family protein [Neobacillus ginsengisoli]
MELLHISSTNESLLLAVKSTRTSATCPSCSKKSLRIHSQYTRRVHDLSISGKSVELLILTRRWFCDQPD